MKKIFIDEKRNLAIERLAIGIVKASENCITVIKKINSISQNPEKYKNPSELINQWHIHLFTNDFHDFIDEWVCPKIIDTDKLNCLQTHFFDYFVSIVPFYYDNKIIISPNLTPRKHKWNQEDYLVLKKKIFEQRYKEIEKITIIDNPKLFDKIDKESINSLTIMRTSSEVIRSRWKKEKKIEKIFSTDKLNLLVMNTCPEYKYFYQKDIFLKYSKEFIDSLPQAIDNFDYNFYQMGTYLHKYFTWCNE